MYSRVILLGFSVKVYNGHIVAYVHRNIKKIFCNTFVYFSEYKEQLPLKSAP